METSETFDGGSSSRPEYKSYLLCYVILAKDKS